MYIAGVFLFSSLATSGNFTKVENQNSSSSAIPELLVTTNQTISLPASIHRFNKITIEQGGNLVIEPNSQDWCVLHSDGDVRINGKITYRNMASGLGEVVVITPSGRTASYTFREQNKGGKGGDGHPALSTNSQPPGRGSVGSTTTGGGGGSGTGYQHRPYATFAGNNANNQYGGSATFAGGGAGGNGGERGSTNGGLLYIYCDGTFDGTGGVIDLSGEKGADGSAGAHGTGSYDRAGGGGGGGGAPGGEGGYCILELKGQISSRPGVVVRGGEGGAGGRGGTPGGGYTSYDAEPGLPGTRGLTGKVDNL